MKFQNVTATAKANVYFDGNVVSHGIVTADGDKKTFGIIRTGSYHFSTEAAERMEIIDGSCQVTLDGSSTANSFTADQSFDVPANSGFTIAIAEGFCQYVCSFL